MGKIVELVDRGYYLDSSMKRMDKELEVIKKELKAHAKRYNNGNLEGLKASAVVGPMSFSSADPQRLFNYLKEQDRESEFWDLIKVKIKETSKLIGESGMTLIGDSTTLPYHKISFKKK